MAFTYAQAGVDVREIRGIQRKINRMIASTNTGVTHPLLGHYAGLFSAGGLTMTLHCDSVGSKILVAQAVGKHDTIGIDAVAMNVNDLICIGSRPIAAVDYLAMSEADERLTLEIMKGLVRGCREAGVALVGGETAMLPDMLLKHKGERVAYDLAVTAAGIMDGKPITGKGMKENDVVVGLASSGLHSNGYSLARKIMPKQYYREMLTPTKIYVKPVMEMVRACDVHGIAHITGGAFSKLSRIGRHGNVGFLLDNVPKPDGVFAGLAARVKSDYELYRTFNMGVGMCIVVGRNEADDILSIAGKHRIKAGMIGKRIRGRDVILQRGGMRISLR